MNIHIAEPYFIQNQDKPICNNCKFFISNKNKCKKFGDVNIITGKYSYENAKDVRNDEDKCGEYAIFFEKNYFKFITVTCDFMAENNKEFLYLVLILFYTFYFTDLNN